MQQYHSSTGEGSLSVFLAELVQRHLESVLAANVPESLPENTTSGQQPEVPGEGADDFQPEAPGGGGDDLQCRLYPEDGGTGGEGKPGFPAEEDGGEGRGLGCDSERAENTTSGQQPEAPGGGGDDFQSESPSEKKPMSEEGQALVLQCEERVKALAWKYADGLYDRFEELVSIGIVGVCEAAVSLPAGFPDPQGYLCQAARHDMLDELYRLHACSTASLDAPLSDSGSFTLHDLLPSLALATVAPVSKRERALHDALMRVSVRQRAAVRRRAGLPGYGVHSLEEIGRVVHSSSDAAHCLDQWGRRKLRRDAVLCEVMGVEVER